RVRATVSPSTRRSGLSLASRTIWVPPRRARPSRAGDHHPSGRSEHEQDGNKTPPEVTRQRGEPPASAHADEDTTRDGGQADWRKGGARAASWVSWTSDRP